MTFTNTILLLILKYVKQISVICVQQYARSHAANRRVL